MASKLLVGTRKGVFVVGRHGREWRIDRADLLGDPVTMVLGERDGTLHAAQDMGHFGVKLKRSRDGGVTWEERPVPAFPPKPEDVVDLDPMRGTPIPWDTKRVWALEGSQRDGELWCGTIRAGSSTRAMPATAGSSSRTFGNIPTASSGWAAAPTTPAFTPCSSTRAIRTWSASASRAAGCG